ncbi:MAG TPA: hypothetical protein VLA36_12860 [Longimicrobiales bacterium]|nr:hypothetical protein [Longimicrobiales bacterium]
MNTKIEGNPMSRWGASLCAMLLFVGCGSPDAGVQETAVAPDEESLQPAAASAADPLASMNTALQDEYRAHATYAQVLIDLGDVVPFSKIVEAEATHITAIGALFTKRELPVPGSALGEVPTYDTHLAACEAAVTGETGNVVIYDGLLLLELPNDVRNVFTNLRLASLEQHLPAFENCVESAAAELEEQQEPEEGAFDPVASMTMALQAELLMQATYAQVLVDLGDLTPFSNIVQAEATHTAAIGALFTKRELPVPGSGLGEVPAYATRLAACEAAVTGETGAVAMYDGLLLLELPNDVRNVFTNLRLASMEQHLPAFESCVESAAAEPEEPEEPDVAGGDVLGQALATALQAELLMQAVYGQALVDLGDMTPFSNIADAEGRHVGSIEALFTTHDIPLPTLSGGDLTTFDTRVAACVAAVDMESAAVAMYDVLLSGQWPNDVLTVFANLRLATLEQHLPAFQKCA